MAARSIAGANDSGPARTAWRRGSPERRPGRARASGPAIRGPRPGRPTSAASPRTSSPPAGVYANDRAMASQLDASGRARHAKRDGQCRSQPAPLRQREHLVEQRIRIEGLPPGQQPEAHRPTGAPRRRRWAQCSQFPVENDESIQRAIAKRRPAFASTGPSRRPIVSSRHTSSHRDRSAPSRYRSRLRGRFQPVRMREAPDREQSCRVRCSSVRRRAPAFTAFLPSCLPAFPFCNPAILQFCNFSAGAPRLRSPA